MSMNKNWHGLIKVLEIEYVQDGNIIWSQKDLYNTLHLEGEEFILDALFVSGLPPFYYFGLEDRGTVAVGDTMASIEDEPTTNGYQRQAISSIGQFTIDVVDGVHVATSPVLTFSATGGSWGPVRNLFLTQQTDNSGDLVATVPLTQRVTVSDTASINVRMGLGLRDCP